MDERDKTILGRNLEYIAKALASSGKARDVVYELRECQVLSAEDADKLLVSMEVINFKFPGTCNAYDFSVVFRLYDHI